jgi:hypothetical protein
MTPLDIRESLTEIRDAVAVPPVDTTRFDRRVRRYRRTLRLRRAGLAAGAAAAVVASVAIVPHVLPQSEPSPVASAAPADGVPVVLDGRVRVVAPDGSLSDTGLEGTPVGRLDGRLVVLDGHRLVGVGDGPIDDVVTAYVHRAGVTYETTEGLIEFAGVDGRNSAQGPGRLLAATATTYVDDEGAGPLIHDPAGIHPVDLGSDSARVELDRVEAAGRTVVFVHDGGVEVYDASGERRDGFLGGATGALSPDGTTYAYAPDAEELDDGMATGLSYYDTRSRDVRSVPLAEPAVDLRWYDGAVYVVTSGTGRRTLWRCDAAACAEVLTAGTSLSLR